MTTLILLVEALAAPLVGAAVFLSFLFSRRRGRLSGFLSELPERLGGLSAEARARLKGRRVWWLHAASAGEVGGLVPLIEELAARPDGPAVLLTTTTTAGREAARWGAKAAWVQLAPIDAWPCVARFLKAARPERLVLAETELWPTTILLAARAGLRPVLVNGRLTERSLARWRRAGFLVRPALAALSAVGAQTEAEAGRFVALGAPPAMVSVVGNAKYDRGTPPAAAQDADFRLQRLGWLDASASPAAPLFVAGSTHPKEEDAVLAGFLQARARAPGLRLLLAPRHVERADEAWRGLQESALRCFRWSRIKAGVAVPPDVEAVLVDEMGALSALYARALVAFVGGTFVPVGGHNLLEPALAGVPVLYGPHVGHVELPAAELARAGGGFPVKDAFDLGDRLVELASSPEKARAAGAAARASAGTLRGAAARA
ncbi:MAG: hypothetical protein KGM24_06905, partial [Elusimicrobia bacterium]|nr:hypothetical protein [Elusimicrobiota bacterium]